MPGGHNERSDPHVVPLGGLVFEMVLDQESVFALHQVTVPLDNPGSGPGYRSSSMAVSRVDRRTREVVRGDSLCFGFAMAMARPSDTPATLAAAVTGAWVVVRDPQDDERRLVHLDSHRLRPSARMDHTGVGYALAVGSRTLWAMADPDLYCADATTGQLRADGPQGPGASEIATDGAGVYLNTPSAMRPDRSGIYVVEPDAACRW